MLDNPHGNPAHGDAYSMHRRSEVEYRDRLRTEAAKYTEIPGGLAAGYGEGQELVLNTPSPCGESRVIMCARPAAETMGMQQGEVKGTVGERIHRLTEELSGLEGAQQLAQETLAQAVHAHHTSLALKADADVASALAADAAVRVAMVAANAAKDHAKAATDELKVRDAVTKVKLALDAEVTLALTHAEATRAKEEAVELGHARLLEHARLPGGVSGDATSTRRGDDVQGA